MSEGEELEKNSGLLSKYGSLGGTVALGTAVAGTFVYARSNITSLKKDQAALTEKVLTLIESQGDQKIVTDKLSRIHESTQNLENVISTLKLDFQEFSSRLRVMEEIIRKLGFEIPGDYRKERQDTHRSQGGYPDRGPPQSRFDQRHSSDQWEDKRPYGGGVDSFGYRSGDSRRYPGQDSYYPEGPPRQSQPRSSGNPEPPQQADAHTQRVQSLLRDL